MDITTVIEKVRKLLALATSANEHEAARASAKAAELMRAYQVEEAALAVENSPDEEIVSDNIIETFREVPRWRASVAMGVCDSLNVSGARPRLIRFVTCTGTYAGKLSDSRKRNGLKRSLRLGSHRDGG